MQIVITGKNLNVSDALQDYVEKKTNRLDRYLSNIDEARVELTSQHAKSAQDRQVAQITLRSTNGAILRSEERSADMRASVDAAVDKLTRQIKRYKGKHWQSHQRSAAEVPMETEEPEEEIEVVRTKTFRTRPMSTEEAIAQMEMLGHDFFVFFDTISEGFNVVYRRRDGGYGLLIPELG